MSRTMNDGGNCRGTMVLAYQVRRALAKSEAFAIGARRLLALCMLFALIQPVTALAAATITSWVTTPTTMTVGTSLTLSVDVAPAAGGGLPCDATQGCSSNSFGTVRFLVRIMALGKAPVQATVVVVGGTPPTVYRASLSWIPATAGSRTVTAQYLGTTPNAPSSVSAS